MSEQAEPEKKGEHKRDHSASARSQEEIDANNYVNNLMDRLSVIVIDLYICFRKSHKMMKMKKRKND